MGKQTTFLRIGFIDMNANGSQPHTCMERLFEVGEIIISVFQAKCALMKLVVFSATGGGIADLQSVWPH